MTKRTFWDRAAERYARRPVQDEAAYAYTLERTRAHLAPDGRVLELGCGTGTSALKLADATGHIVASDLSAEMIRIARDKAAAQGVTNVTFVQTDAAAPPDGEYDAVLAFNLLHLLPDPEAALVGMAERVKPGGYFISKTVCLDEPGMRLKYRLLLLAVPLFRALGKAPDFHRFDIAGLERMITGAGFDIIETGNHPASPPSRFVVARKPL